MRAIWAGRSRVDAAFWRLYFVICDDGEPVGMQDLIGTDSATLGTVESFSWLAPAARGRGLGKEARAAILHLAFEASRPGRRPARRSPTTRGPTVCPKPLGYTRNGTSWATRGGAAAELL